MSHATACYGYATSNSFYTGHDLATTLKSGVALGKVSSDAFNQLNPPEGPGISPGPLRPR